MKKIRIKAPAKINLSLKVEKKRPDGFHPIESVMAAINLFDYIDIEVKEKDADSSMPTLYSGVKINISSNSNEIPNDSSNIAHKAAELFFEACSKILEKAVEINIYIEKNIPVCAGLAGGSTNAAAVIFGLNKIFNEPLCLNEIDMLLGKLGSDLNFCFYGGKKLCKGRGEVLEPLEFEDMHITLIKPKDLKISAREAYQRFDEMTEISKLPNDLEAAILPYYEEIQYLNKLSFQMSGSGPTFFSRKQFLDPVLRGKLKEKYLIIENLKTIDFGVVEVY